MTSLVSAVMLWLQYSFPLLLQEVYLIDVLSKPFWAALRSAEHLLWQQGWSILGEAWRREITESGCTQTSTENINQREKSEQKLHASAGKTQTRPLILTFLFNDMRIRRTQPVQQHTPEVTRAVLNTTMCYSEKMAKANRTAAERRTAFPSMPLQCSSTKTELRHQSASQAQI